VAELEVHVIAPERRLWRGQAVSVTAPAANGYVGILPQHEPLLATMKAGQVRVRPVQGEPLEFDVDGGVLSVDSDVVMILVNPGQLLSRSS
jgi:F-type H+-transporting ATPase subunit epsilon